jgi:hypothetical protein
MTTHQIHLIGGKDDEFIQLTEQSVGNQCQLSCEHRGRQLTAEALDFFEALCIIRLELERDGLIPFCYGASLNVYPSPMARQMGRGKSGYKMKMGKPASKEDAVRIFEEGADVIPSFVKHQRAYFDDWLASLQQ